MTALGNTRRAEAPGIAEIYELRSRRQSCDPRRDNVLSDAGQSVVRQTDQSTPTVEDPVPFKGAVLWTGRACEARWTVRFEEVIEAAADAEAEAVARPTWRLRFTSDKDEAFVQSWSPKDRILFGTLAGWSKASIGDLKRALVHWSRAV